MLPVTVSGDGADPPRALLSAHRPRDVRAFHVKNKQPGVAAHSAQQPSTPPLTLCGAPIVCALMLRLCSSVAPHDNSGSGAAVPCASHESPPSILG